MKLLPPLPVQGKKEAGALPRLDTEKQESRIEHYLALAAVALTVKKKSKPSLADKHRPRLSKTQTNRRA
jgi:hypothetical protein